MTLLDENPVKTDSLPPLRWETVCCNLCGSDDHELFHRERVPYFNKELDFTIVRCRRCGLVYTNPRLSDYNATYLFSGEDDFAHIEDHARSKQPVFHSALKKISSWQTRCGLPSGGKLLDLGCGSGHFIHAAKLSGFDGLGIEPARGFARYAAENVGVNVLHDDIYSVELPENHFDVITAWDVIEHVSDPQAMLARCEKWLAPGGLLALRFPSSTWQKIKGVVFHQWLHSDRPSFGPTMHLYFFNEKTIRCLAQKVGLDVLDVFTTAAETNTENILLDGVKLVSHFMIRGIELCSGKSLGNLEVYLRKAPV